MKNYIRKILYSRPVAKLNVKVRLLILQKAYEGLGKYASVLEGGIHPKHRLMNYHQFFIDKIEPDDVILDLGCGNGLVALDIAKKAKDVIGVDLNENNIKTARNNLRKFHYNNVEFILGDVTKIELNKKFDKIILSNILEHIENRIEFLSNLRNISSVILLRVPMINRDWVTLYKQKLGMEYRLDKTHFIEYTEESLRSELQAAKWALVNNTIQFGELWGRAEQTT